MRIFDCPATCNNNHPGLSTFSRVYLKTKKASPKNGTKRKRNRLNAYYPATPVTRLTRVTRLRDIPRSFLVRFAPTHGASLHFWRHRALFEPTYVSPVHALCNIIVNSDLNTTLRSTVSVGFQDDFVFFNRITGNNNGLTRFFRIGKSTWIQVKTRQGTLHDVYSRCMMYSLFGTYSCIFSIQIEVIVYR